MKQIVILGGSGNAGRAIARLLLQRTDAHVILASRNRDRCAEWARELDRDRVETRAVDASDVASLKLGFRRADLVVVASSTTSCVSEVAQSAMEVGADYLDLQLSLPSKWRVLRSLSERIGNERRCFITDGGFHPGIPGVLIRRARQLLDELESVNVYCLLHPDWHQLQMKDETAAEFVRELRETPMEILREGKWRKLKWSEMPKHDFGEPHGVTLCAPMGLQELHEIRPRLGPVQEMGFFVSGMNWFVDYVAMPFGMAGSRIHDSIAVPAGRMLAWGLERFSKPPYGNVIEMEARGFSHLQPAMVSIRLEHPDSYLLTAAPVVACIEEWMRSRRPGLFCQAGFVEPQPFLDAIAEMGIQVKLSCPEGQPPVMA